MRSSAVEALDFRLGLRVGDKGAFSRFVTEGIFDRRRLGELLRSFRAALLDCGRRSGALDSVGNAGAVVALAKIFGWLLGFGIGAVFWEIRGGRPLAGLNGFFEDFGRVGEGTGGSSSSDASSSEVRSVGCHLASAPLAKIFDPALGAFVAPLRRGERESEAIDIGDGSDISTSIGVPAPPANIVWARPNGVRVLFLSALTGSGESIDNSVKSVDEGKSISPFVLTDDNGISLLSEPENSFADAAL